MKKILFAFLMFFLFTSLLQAQWWVQGGNLLWPYGKVSVLKGLDLSGQVTENWSNKLFVDAKFGQGVTDAYGSFTRLSVDKTIKNNYTTLIGSESRVDITVDSSVSNNQWSGIQVISSTLKYSQPRQANKWGEILGYNQFFDFYNGSDTVETQYANGITGYYFKGGLVGSNVRLKSNYHAFYSFPDAYQVISSRFLAGYTFYHFYGNGDYPSYFGGVVRAKQFQLNALNTAPANATAAGTTGEIRIDVNYIYVCVATNTWKRAALATW